MWRRNAVRLVTDAVRAGRFVSPRTAPLSVPGRRFTDAADGAPPQPPPPPPPPFDAALLDFLVCPLSKKPLRYEASTNELINEELGIAYPILDGIPNMVPQDARLIQTDADAPEQQQ